MTFNRPRRRERGFTLIEVVIATAMLIALVGSMFAYLDNLLASRAAIRQHSDKELASTTLLDRLEADLTTCLVGDAKTGAGVRGDATSIRILSRSVSANLAERGAMDPLVFSDLQESQFRFSEGSRLIEARKRAMSPLDAQSAPTYWPIGSAGHVRFRYHDGSTWRDSFDTLAEGRLPVAVEVAVWFSPWPGDDDETDQFNEENANDRLTFDDEPLFDERAYAEESNLELLPPPLPDRVRVIAILDAGVDEGGVEEVMEPES